MLKFALDYHAALDTITGERDMKLRKYELKDTEWDIARQLRDILEVFFIQQYFTILITTILALKTCHPLLFSSDT